MIYINKGKSMQYLFILSWVLICTAEFKDEMDVYEEQCVGEDRHQCPDGTCIWRKQICDHVVDCSDGSDESACINYSPDLLLCNRTHQFLCEDELKCIPLTWLCNENAECVDASDEKNCTALSNTTSTCKGFQCDGQKCISNLWACDGQYDCEDKTDETLETCRKSRHAIRPPLPDFMCLPDLNSGNALNCLDESYCLPVSLVCDGIVDCRDHTDEGSPLCDTWATMCVNSSCGSSANCVRSAKGPVCQCPVRTKYDNVTKSCQNVDMCAQPRPTCSQICDERGESTFCQCEKGYNVDRLKLGIVCYAPDPEALMFFSTENTIGYIKMKSREMVTLFADVKQGNGVAFDGKYVYWADSASGHLNIQRARIENATGTREILISVGLEDAGEFALDFLGGHIYLTDLEGRIMVVCRLDGSICSVLKTGTNLPKAVVVDPVIGTMYFTDYENKVGPVIMRSYMDGSGAEILVSGLQHYPTTLALDSPSRRLYYVDFRSGRYDIFGVHLGNKKTFHIATSPYRINAVAVFENTVYWSEEPSPIIIAIDKVSGRPSSTFKPLSINKTIYGIYIYHPVLHMAQHNPCAGNPCSHLCLLSYNLSYTCACPHGMKLNGDNATCEHEPSYRPVYLIAAGGNELVRLQYDSLGRAERHNVTHISRVQAMAYDKLRDTLYIYDGQQKIIRTINMTDFSKGDTQPFLDRGFVNIIDMDFDHWTNTLYILDAGRGALDVVSLETRQRAMLVRFIDETPVSLCVLPPHGRLLVAMSSEAEGEGAHIDSYWLDGSGREHLISTDLLGPRIRMSYSQHLDKVFVADEGNHIISVMGPFGTGRETFRQLSTAVTGVAVTDTYVFWAGRGHTLYWGSAHEAHPVIRHMNFEFFPNTSHIHIQATSSHPKEFDDEYSQHPCQKLPCTHVCVQHRQQLQEGQHGGVGYRCLCPPGLLYTSGGCSAPLVCPSHRYYCHRSNTCFDIVDRCNGRNDCPEGEDEEGCHPTTPAPPTCSQHEKLCDGVCVNNNMNCKGSTTECSTWEFRCPEDGLCIGRELVCDGRGDCARQSDEIPELCNTFTCLDTEFMCTSGSCILSAFKCDGEEDCLDGSDELQCDKIICPPESFKCASGQCVALTHRCDGGPQCADGSDEVDCVEAVTEVEEEPVLCAEWEYPCSRNRKKCIPFSARCNQRIDCPGATDEKDCTFGYHHGKCNGHDAMPCRVDARCIWRHMWCDGKKDCSDGSDETPNACFLVNRTSRFYPSVMYPSEECSHGFLCDNGQCVEWRTVCDQAPDCFDGSDENGACFTACEKHNCTHHCRATPKGASCACPDGYRANDNGVCTDIDECARDICAHECHNYAGGYSCSCHPGYAIKSDRHLCKATLGHLMVVFASGGIVHSLLADGRAAVHYTDNGFITGLDLDYRRNKIYVAYEEENKLVEVQNTTQVTITNIGKPRKVSVDWVTGNVYFTSGGYLRVCHTERQRCARLQKLPAGSLVQSLTIDPSSHRVFYCLSREGAPDAVWTANTAGRGARDVLPGACRGLAVDTYNQRLFVTEDGPARLIRMDYAGRNVKELISNIPNFESPTDLAIFEDKAYFIIPRSLKLNRCNLFGRKKTCEIYRQGMLNPTTFVLRHESIQRKDLVDLCDGFQCDNVCVIEEEGPVCVCELGLISGTGECPTGATENLPLFNGAAPTPRLTETSTTTSAVWGSIVALMLAVSGIALYYHWRRTRAHTTPLTVHFRSLGGGSFAGTSATQRGSVTSTTQLEPGFTGRTEFDNPMDFIRNLWHSSIRRTRPVTKPIESVDSSPALNVSDTESAEFENDEK